MNQNSRTRYWFWGGITGLVLVSVVVVLVLVNQNKPRADESPFVSEHEPSSIAPSLPNPVSEPLVQTVQEDTPLPAMDFPPGSIEEACGLNAFPSYWSEISNPKGSSELPSSIREKMTTLESEECRLALENHLNPINPFLWGATYENPQFNFVVLDSPLTFERIFADPLGDFLRVQDKLFRSECLLKDNESNWDLEETCHAEALMNYALVNRFCFNGGIWKRSKTIYYEDDIPTPNQDRFMWKQLLENDWVRKRCEELDSTLELTEHHHELTELILKQGDYYTLDSSEHAEMVDMLGPRSVVSRYLIPTLIEMAARLGDEAAGLTQPFTKVHSHQYVEEGYKVGRFSDLLSSDSWKIFALKKEPSADRFLRAFTMLALLDARRPDPRDEIEFDWKFVARHLCTPPFVPNYADWRRGYVGNTFTPEDEIDVSDYSCKEIVHEIRQREFTIVPVLTALDKFEQVALELDVYD